MIVIISQKYIAEIDVFSEHLCMCCMSRVSSIFMESADRRMLFVLIVL